MPLSPSAASFLQMLHRIDAPRMHELPIEVVRRNYEKMLFLYREAPVPGVVTQDFQVLRRPHEGGALALRVYRPEDAGTAPLPLFLWLHGGGWTLGSIASYEPLCRALCRAGGFAVAALAYRLAPEQRFPAALDDVQACLRWLRRNALAQGFLSDRIAVGGDSAGGNLAAVAALMARDDAADLRAQVLVYPAVDCLNTPAPDSPFAEGHFLDLDGLRWFQHNYLEAEADRRDWRASPVLAPDLAGVAPALIISAECDLLTPAALAYARRLGAAGVASDYREVEGTIHGFLTFPRIFPQAADVIEQIAGYLRGAFALEDFS